MEYNIGSFNMHRFGRGIRDFDTIARIIKEEQLDIVALQEVFSEGAGVRRLLEQDINHYLWNWDFCWACPKESSDLGKQENMLETDTRGEGYAYIWNKRRFKLAEVSKLGETRKFEPRIINSLSNDVDAAVNCSVFARTPYYIRLFPCYGGFFELRLINIHIFFGNENSMSDIEKRQSEYNVLIQDVYPRINQRRYGANRQAFTVAMGDYNLNLIKPQYGDHRAMLPAAVYNYSDSRSSFQIITVQDQLTTLRNPLKNAEAPYANNYDHFSFSSNQFRQDDVTFCAIDASKYCGGNLEHYFRNISDHLPIKMTFRI